MSQEFDFEQLVQLCRQTHEETRQSAARAVDHSLVVRNWLFGWYIGYPEIQQTLSVNSVLLPTGIAPTVPMREKSG